MWNFRNRSTRSVGLPSRLDPYRSIPQIRKMLRCQRTVFLGDSRDIGAGIEDPDVFGGSAFLEEDDIGFYALAVRGECAARQAQDRVQVAVLHEDFKNLSGLVLKEAVVRQDDRSPSSGFEDVHDMLNEIELFVAGLNSEIFPLRRLICALCAEWWIGEDASIEFSSVGS